MKALKIAKFQIHGTLLAVRIYYAIVLLIITFLAIESLKSNGNMHSSGFEFATTIFLFVAGLNSFKDNFKFTQANNIARKTFIKGLIIAAFPISLFMSMIDLIINRVYNLFVQGPTNYDMIYGMYRRVEGNISVWTQSNDLATLMGTFIWQFAAYSVVFLLGILISLIYYRSNNIMKVVVSITPGLLVMLFFNITPASFRDSTATFIASVFGWQSQNPYIAVLTFSMLGLLFSGFINLLTRKAELKV